MHRAAKIGDTAKVLEFIESGADVNAVDSVQATVLYWASSKHHTDIVELLLARNANVNAQTKWGSTPLHAAADRGYSDIARLLVAHGADTNAQNNNDDAPLHAAAARGHAEIVQLLVFSGGADLNLTNLQRRTPYDEAEHAGMTDVAQFLSTLVENAIDGTTTGFTLPTSHLKRDVIEKTPPPGSGSDNDRRERQQAEKEETATRAELTRIKGDLCFTQLKLKACQNELEDKSMECESLRAELASTNTFTSETRVKKTKQRAPPPSPPSPSGLPHGIVKILLNCVALSHFASARSALLASIAPMPLPRFEELRRCIANKGSGIWVINCDYEIIGAGPIASSSGGSDGNGCRRYASFVFRIRHVKFGVLILKVKFKNQICISIDNLSHNRLNSGFSENSTQDGDADDNSDKSRSIPLVIPSSPYLLPILHSYNGSANAFAYAGHLTNVDTSIFDFSAPNATFLVVPEYETTLEKWVADRRRFRSLNDTDCLLFLFQVLSGVDALASHGIVHCNIRSSCVLIIDDWRAVIADFDAAEDVSESANGSITVYSKSDLSAVGTMFLRLFAPTDDDSGGDAHPTSVSKQLRHFLSHLRDREPIEACTAVGVVALMLWCDDEMLFCDEEDVAHWILQEIYHQTAEDVVAAACSADVSLAANQDLSVEQISNELKKRFLFEASTEYIWLGYKLLRKFWRGRI